MKHYTLLDNASALLWWAGNAESPEAAVIAALADVGECDCDIVEQFSPNFSNESGFFVYETPHNDIAAVENSGADDFDYAIMDNWDHVAYFRIEQNEDAQ